MKATNIKTGKYGDTWFITAKVGNINYQEEFKKRPTGTQTRRSPSLFEANHAGLNEQARKPDIVKPHHSEF